MRPPSAAEREPLRGRPERALEVLRGVLAVVRMVATVAGPVPVLRAVGPHVARVAPDWGIVVAPVVYVATAVLLHRLLGALLARLYWSRDLACDGEALVVSRERRLGSPRFRRVERLGEGVRIPVGSIDRLFRVRLPTPGDPVVAVGIWSVGEEGRAREVWLPLARSDAEDLLDDLVARTGLEVRVPGAGGNLGERAPVEEERACLEDDVSAP